MNSVDTSPPRSGVRRLLTGASFGALIAAGVAPVLAAPVLPTGGVVRAGSASISNPSVSSLTVTQGSSKAIVDWGSFSIGSGGSVRFDNGSGATLNRVTGAGLSSIDGRLSATGSVYLLNPNGVIVGKSGVVDVGGTFVASTLGLSDSAFLKGGDLTFTGSSTSSVVNLGHVGALGGEVVMIASTVKNAGAITAANGDVGLLAGTQVLVRDLAQGGGRFAVRLGGAGTSVTNTGAIAAAAAELRANGGDVYALAGDTAGVIRATGVGSQGGRVFLTAGDAGSVTLGGTIVARGANGAGGAIETSAGKVAIGAARIDAGPGGSWLLDPNDLTIDQTAANTIATTLDGGTNVTQQTTASGTGGSGDINVAPNVNLYWTTNAALTLSAYRNIDVGAGTTLTSTGGGAVNLRADSTGTGVGTVVFSDGAKVSTGGLVNIYFNPQSNPAGSSVNVVSYTSPTDYTALISGYPSNLRTYMLVNTINDLQNIQNDEHGLFALSRDIDASATRSWNDGSGFSPVGQNSPFYGSLDGQGHAIKHLFINRPSQSYVGLFSTLGLNTNVTNLLLIDVDISGGESTGALAGRAEAYFQKIIVTGKVTGGNQTGGIVGSNSGALLDATFDGTVRGEDSTGGLVGDNGTLALISNGYATGSVSGGVGVGGVAGLAESFSHVSRIENVYSSAAVSGASLVGGIVGDNSARVNDVYASGSVTSTGTVGGLFGRQQASGTIDNGYWDFATTGQSVAIGADQGSTTTVIGLGGATGLSAYAAASYAGFDFTSAGPWVIFEGSTRPMLRSEYSTTITNSHQLQLIDLNRSGSYTLAADVDLSATANTSDVWNPAVGFVPIASRPGAVDPFMGSFDGQGHTISNLSITSVFDRVGLFGNLGRTGSVSNLILTGATVTGGYYTGALVGDAFGKVTNVRVSGSVKGAGGVGGLVGVAEGGSIVTASVSSAQVTGSAAGVGGLIGAGLGSVIGSWASGTVGGQVDVGGLVGFNDGFISTSYASGAATSFFTVGGLVGENAGGGFILDAYATGSATGTNDPNAAATLQPFGAGGLVGLNTGQIVEAYASGQVSGAAAGGLVGTNTVGGPGGLTTGTIKNAYWDVGTTGQTAAYNGATSQPTGVVGIGGATGPSPYAQSTYALEFGTSGPWVIFDGATRPLLRSEYSSTITNGHQLQLIDLNRAGNYTLATNIDLSEISNPSGVWNPALGFVPIASRPGAADPFIGSFDGQGHGISNLKINSTYDNVGLFGNIGAAGSIANLNLVSVDVTGGSNVGALAGSNLGAVSGATVSGFVYGKTAVGGLIGLSVGSIDRSSSSAFVQGGNGCDCQFAGGLVGYADGPITNSFATGSVFGYQYVGGLGGRVVDVANSYATGGADGTYSDIGGLVGQALGQLTNDYATGGVNGGRAATSANVGGLVGYLNSSGVISSSYASTEVNGYGASNVGGLVGTSDGSILNAYTLGTVGGSFGVGGLVGRANGGSIANVYAAVVMYPGGSGPAGGLIGYTGSYNPSLVNGFWDMGPSGQTAAVATGYTLAQTNVVGLGVPPYATSGGPDPFRQTSYSGFDFSASGAWVIFNGSTRPILRSEASTTITNGHQLQLIALNPSGVYTLANDIDLSGTGNGGPVDVWNTSSGFVPIGNAPGLGSTFVGSLDGQGHTISNLSVFTKANGAGLFDAVGPKGVITDLSLTRYYVAGGYYTGGLAADNYGTISDIKAEGSVSGNGGVGGLIGVNEAGATVTAIAANLPKQAVGYFGVGVYGYANDVGGVIGVNLGTVTNVIAAANVTGQITVGGLIGLNIGSVQNVQVTTAVTGLSEVGGLIGTNTGTITASSALATPSLFPNSQGFPDGGATLATGAVGYAGGLVGVNLAGASITDSYATDPSSGAALVGRNDGTVTRAYATGAAGAGIATLNDGSLLDTFWNLTTTGTNTGVAGGSGSNIGVLPIGGLTSLDPLQPSGYPSFDFVNVWTIQPGVSPPTLRGSPGQ